MAQEFEYNGSRGGKSASGSSVAYSAGAVPVVDVSSVMSPVPVVDLGALARTAGERALATMIGAANAVPVDDRLAARSVDPQLFLLLSRLDTETADESTLVEAAAAAERVEAAAHAIKLRAAAALSRREAMRPAALAQREGAQRDVAGDELAVRLRITVRAGMDLVRRGRALEGPLCATGDALAQGVIDAARARVIVDGLEHVNCEVAATVESRVLGRAPERTVAQLRSDVAKALIAVDADEAAERARYRASQRRVSRPRAHPDGVASMRLEGPADDVLALDVALQAAARAAKTGGDARSMDQLRFDALTGIGHHALATGRLGTINDHNTNHHDAKGRGENDPGRDCRGGDDTGEHNTTGGQGHGGNNAGGDCFALALATQHGHRPTIGVTIGLDQLLPPAPARTTHSPAPTDSGGVRSGRSRSGVRRSCGGAGNDSPTSTGPVSGDDGLWPPPLPGEHLDADQVPTLDGYGPISPLAARALAAGGDWVRIITDPVTGAVLDVGHTRYRPTPAMIDHLLARDRTCARPGCSHRASECQLDHTTEWNHQNPSQGGSTAVDNLGPLCGRDHQVKTHGDFHLTQPEPGIFEWTTPTGHRYRRETDGTTTSLTHHTHRPRYGSPTDDDLPGGDPDSGDPDSGDPDSGDPDGGDPPDYGPPPF